jgi:hypothetical protein
MCPHCENVLANPAAAQCPVCLKPLRSTGAPTLKLDFPTGELKVAVGQHLILGRDAGQSPAASTLPEVSPSAALQSIMPAPVISRRSLTICAVI